MIFVKDPDAVRDYQLKLEEWLDGDTISTATWTVPSGITKDSQSETTTVATIWLSGGTAGTEYELVCRIVTAAARTEDFSITVLVRESVAVTIYGSLAEVAALVPLYTSSGSFSSSTRPTEAQVQQFLERVSALMNTLLAKEGFDIPVTQADAKLALDDFVVMQAAHLAAFANGAGPFVAGADEMRYSTPTRVILRDAELFLEANALGLERLGATRTYSTTYGLECRTSDDAGDEIYPMFQRKMMGHKVEDWDT